MRKFIVFLLLAVASVGSAFAQGTTTVQSLYSNAASGTKLTDTVTNAGTVTMSSASVKGAPNSVTVTATFTKLTGTVAGTATLLGSVNGTDWFAASSTSYTVTDLATQGKSWELTDKFYLYYRVNVVGSGTSTYTVKGDVQTVLHP